MAIYTKKGDKGKTSLLGQENRKSIKVFKDTLKVRVLGTLDELNSSIGVAISFSNVSEITLYLKDVQRNLLTIGSIVAGRRFIFKSEETKRIEKTIDRLEKKLPLLSNFILPGGTVLAAHLHLARSVARRLERIMVLLSRKDNIKPQILEYLNRLSDYLFVLARLANYEAKVKEEVWVKIKKK